VLPIPLDLDGYHTKPVGVFQSEDEVRDLSHASDPCAGLVRFVHLGVRLKVQGIVELRLATARLQGRLGRPRK
jgi:hypothetical protein